jgi:1-acyl-sn-glycerol-3-phosphate acyltransferase
MNINYKKWVLFLNLFCLCTMLLIMQSLSIIFLPEKLSSQILKQLKKVFVSNLVFLSYLYFHFQLKILSRDLEYIKGLKRTITISNHQTYGDWLYIWILKWYLNKDQDVVVFLKNDIQFIPIFGWVIKMFDFIFLKRDWKKDKVYMTKKIKSIVSKDSYNFLIFPEATVLCDETIEKCKSFYIENTGQEYTNKHVLIPRYKGLLNTLLETPKDIVVIDLCMIYEKGENTFAYDNFTFKDIFYSDNKHPKTVTLCVDVNKNLQKYIDTPEIFKEKVVEIFDQKEKLIDNYNGEYNTKIIVEPGFMDYTRVLCCLYCFYILCTTFSGIYTGILSGIFYKHFE